MKQITTILHQNIEIESIKGSEPYDSTDECNELKINNNNEIQTVINSDNQWQTQQKQFSETQSEKNENDKKSKSFECIDESYINLNENNLKNNNIEINNDENITPN
eukprot:126810_1